MTIEFGPLCKIGLIVYLLIFVFMLIKKKYTLKQHLLFFLIFAICIVFLNLMLFPIDIQDFNSIPFVEARLYKHNLIPFYYIIRDMQGAGAVEAIANSYFSEVINEAQRNEYIMILQISLNRILLFNVANFGLIALISALRGWLAGDRSSLRQILMFPGVFIFAIDLAAIAKYYTISLEVEMFDTSFIFFQLAALILGYQLFKFSKLLWRPVHE
ncbi:MAG: hypothetical protein VB070_04335 [Clostridiaceae bacterium]|nr:hypothetical protein [Clostridiaceae bacterium]